MFSTSKEWIRKMHY